VVAPSQAFAGAGLGAWVLKLTTGLTAGAVFAGVSSRVTVLGTNPRTEVRIRRPRDAAVLFTALAKVGFVQLPPNELIRAAGTLGRRPVANTNEFMIVPAIVCPDGLAGIIDRARQRASAVTVLVPVTANDFAPGGPEWSDPETGRPVLAPADPATELSNYLGKLIRVGRSRGVVVEPLVVTDPERDLNELLIGFGRW
jgi:hypothetical protein